MENSPNDNTGGPERSAQSEPRNGWLTVGRFTWLLAAALALVFPLVALGIRTFFYRDFGVLAYPFAILQRLAFWNAELPMWNPYSHCGVPLMAQWGTNCYPPALFYLILPLPWSLNLFMLLHLILAGAGMYRLAARWTNSSFGAGFAGIAYVFNGVTLSCLLWPNYIVSLAWLPWIFLLAEDACKRGGRSIVLCAVVSALQVLSGTPEVTFLTWLLLGAMLLVEVLSRRLAMIQVIPRLSLALLLAAGLTMIQMLPFFDLLAHSQRDQNFGTSRWAMPVWGWANLLVPMFHNAQTPYGTWFQYGQEFLSSYYLGLGTLLLGVSGAILAGDRRAITLAAAAVLCWVMAMGSDGFVFDWVKRAFPLMGVARFPIKFVILTGFIVPLLAAWAISRLNQFGSKRSFILLAGLATGAGILMVGSIWLGRLHPLPYDQWHVTSRNAIWRAILAIGILTAIWATARNSTSRWRWFFQLAAFALVVGDAITLSPKLVPTLPSTILIPGFWEAAQKSRSPEPGQTRIMISPAADKLMVSRNVPDLERDFTSKRLAEWSNLNLLDLVPKVNGAVTLRIREQDRVEQFIYNPSNHVGEGLLDFLAARWTSSPDNPVEWIERTNACPVVSAGQRPVFVSEANILPRLVADDFNPREVVFLPESARAAITATNRTRCQVTNVVFGLNRATMQVNADEASLVVISQTYHHPWKAFVDQQPVEIFRANAAFQAIQVPAGRHEIRLVYRDRSFALGAALTVLSALACVGLWFLNRPGR